MNSRFRQELDMGVRALEHCLANPADTPRFVQLVGTLSESVQEGRAYASQFDSGVGTRRGTVAERKEIRADLRPQMMDVARIGRDMAEDFPELRGFFRVVSTDVSYAALIAKARGYAAKVVEHQDRYAASGFGAEALATFTRTIDALEGSVTRTHAARRAHIGARAEMARIAGTIMSSVDGLDAINQRRFRGDPEELEAWNRARNVAWPNGRKPKGGEKVA